MTFPCASPVCCMQTPFFIGAHALAEDKQKLIDMVKRMKETVIAMEAQ